MFKDHEKGTIYSATSRLTLVYLPPYNPNLNVIEELCGWMKSTVINNVFFDSVQKTRKTIQGFIRHINDTPVDTIERLCL
ncbi:transposase [Paenibacillus sp. FA6]|uniref:transposase n=1 Tax=Paenibacillus sp. FA6 TaxID=3413029 RepID=UPI003F658623